MFWILLSIVLLISVCMFFVRTDCDIRLAWLCRFGKPISCLRGRVVFVTGASSGIGEQLAYVLAKNGVKLVLAARRRDELERVKSACLANSDLSPRDILILPVDLLDLTGLKTCFDEAVRHFGRIHVLFNNAGRSQRARFDEIELEVHREIFELNVFSVITLTRLAVKHFGSFNGTVAVTSSVAGLLGSPDSSSYTATKHAIHGYMNSLRVEKENGNVTVTVCCPGPTFTNFLTESFTEKSGKKYGVPVAPTDKRMTAERCAELSALAVANQVDEAWIAVFPWIPVLYFHVFLPRVFKLLLSIFGSKKLFAARDSKPIAT